MANKKRLIDPSKAKKDFNLYFGGVSHAVIANKILDEQPTVDAVEVVHGEWIEDTYCSNCRWFAEDEEGHIVQSFHNYCPNCGAKMDGVAG